MNIVEKWLLWSWENIKGITDAILVTTNDIETNSQIVNGTEQIDGQTYKTAHLE